MFAIGLITNLWISFLSGLFAPLGAVCAIPLYPAFLVYLSNQTIKKSETKTHNIPEIYLGALVMAGVITSMFIFGLLIVSFFHLSIVFVLSYLSPVLFLILAVFSILLILDIDTGGIFPHFLIPKAKNPGLSAFLYGSFFGLIVLPCNPASLFVLFAVSSSTVGFLENLLNFIIYGAGMGLPLFILSALASGKQSGFTRGIIKWQTEIRRIAGILMLGVALYYLIFVFRIAG
ncbi:cytochrome c biogenesis CcdA family protein [Methanochimaera problematica]|uniref:cytochrome c biogenesis CcdA family protein n=1 Tax=Methanochimaera problematica TaxID=2609417 RepID=UPI00293947A3|nr:cytochrome c biogenesis protein CcdA [Methanoplanus sp. FWC-SCC4]